MTIFKIKSLFFKTQRPDGIGFVLKRRQDGLVLVFLPDFICFLAAMDVSLNSSVFWRESSDESPQAPFKCCARGERAA